MMKSVCVEDAKQVCLVALVATLCVSTLCGVLPLSLQAEGVSATWKPTAAGTYSWNDAANWNTERPPTNGEDVVNLNIATEGPQTIWLTHHSTLGTISGRADQTISSPDRSGYARAFWNVSVANPNDFAGTWRSGDSGALWYAYPSADYTPYFATFETLMRPALRATTGCVRFGTLTGAGMLYLFGSANTQVDDVALDSRGRTRLAIPANTTLTLGMASAFPSNAVAGAYVRFDASRPDTFTLEAGADGRTHVTEWRDADGGSVKAGVSGSTATPYLSAVKSVRGTPLVDFGAYRSISRDDTYMDFNAFEAAVGPCAGLAFAETAAAREIFLVFEETIPSNIYPFALGALNTYHLHRASNGYLFHNGNAHENVRNGSVTVDGVAKSPSGWGPFSRLHLVTLATAGNITVGTLAIDRNQRSGGVRIAEAIIYTKELTPAERLQNIRYLMRKWRPEILPDHDLDRLFVPGNACTVQVPSAQTVTVDSLDMANAGLLTKTGPGELRLHGLVGESLSVAVRGGRLGIAASADLVTDTAPAVDPLFHLDASEAASLIEADISDGTGRRYISRWNDVRGTGNCATSVVSDIARPYIVEGAANGRNVIDFGEGWIKEWGPTKSVNDWGDASCGDTARLVCSRKFNANAGFVVMRFKKMNGYSEQDHSYLNPPMFGCSEYDFTRWGTKALVTQYNSKAVQTALWEFDGKTHEPADTEPTVMVGVAFTNDFLVVSFTSEQRAMVDRIADDRLNAVGGVQIAEILLYDRTLSPFERQSTQAYLMKKWKNATHPALKSPVNLKALTFSNGAPAELEAGRDVLIDAIDTDGAAFTVKGEGRVTTKTAAALCEGLRVDGGSVTIPSEEDPFPDAVYHFDASNPASLECTYVENGDGTVTTNIVRWLDVRGNGAVATAFTNTLTCSAYPTLQTVATRNGRRMPVVDFGELSKNATKVYKSTSAGMSISVPGWDGKLGEGHVVWCDAHGGCNDRFIFPDSSSYAVHRGERSGQLFCAYSHNPYSQYIKDGYVAVDGVSRSYDYNMNDQQFHVVSLAPSNPIPSNLIGSDRVNQRGGGSYQGELIVFASPLSAERRAFLQQYLAWKWFGEGTCPKMPGNSIKSLELLNGGALTVTGGNACACGALTVTGEATMQGGLVLEEAGTLDFTAASATDVSSVTIDGPFTLPSAGTLRIHVGAGFAGARGSFPLLTATELSGNLAGWTRTIEKSADVKVRVRLDGNTLFLDVLPPGMTVIVR